MVSDDFIQNLAQTIRDRFNPQKIILFGSYASGHPTTDSDLDFLVLMNTSLHSSKQASKIRMSLSPDIPIDVIVRTPQQLRERLEVGDPFFRNIEKKGRLLYENSNPGMD